MPLSKNRPPLKPIRRDKGKVRAYESTYPVRPPPSREEKRAEIIRRAAQRAVEIDR